jgi:hypothetical protein
LVFELRASCSWERHSTTWAITSTLFGLVVLEVGSHFLPRLSRIMIILFHASHCHCIDSSVTLCTTIGWDGVSQTFLPWLALNHDPPHLSLPGS